MRTPPVDVTETAGEYRLVVEVPGATKEGMEVTPGPVPGTIAIKLEARTKVDGHRVLRSERGEREGCVRYERIVPVAWDADTSTARATIEHGILTVSVAKKAALASEPPKRDVL